ncbi:MAG TPA: GTPase Era [Longimicrobiales bacterium]|nr:GTPase Era [Longimicrobiales bacterium]
MSPQPPETSPPPSTRSGYVALVGRPNAGKSTLLNRLVGEHLSIVTPKAQTTWQRVTGIRTEGDVQMVFLDTPGLLEARDLLQRTMLAAALEALAEADVVLLVVDAAEPPTADDAGRILSALDEARAPLFVALNKIDAAGSEAVAGWEAWIRDRLPKASVHRVSAKDGRDIEGLMGEVAAALPEAPCLYPEDEIASDPVRFFVAELVRETVFEQYHQEIPYSVYCQVAEMREDQDPVYIHVDVFVERKSQKGILIGKGGAAIRELGSASRAKIEHFLGRRVYLDLWVKPLESWRKSRAHLGRFGFRLPTDDDRSS